MRDAGDVLAVESMLVEVTSSTPTRETDGLTITAPTDDPSCLLALVRRLDAAQVVVDELTLGQPSLDEVFLALTGHRAEEDTDDDMTQRNLV